MFRSKVFRRSSCRGGCFRFAEGFHRPPGKIVPIFPRTRAVLFLYDTLPQKRGSPEESDRPDSRRERGGWFTSRSQLSYRGSGSTKFPSKDSRFSCEPGLAHSNDISFSSG